MSSPFKGIENEKAQRDSEYMRAGRYLACIRLFDTGVNRKKIANVRFETVIVAVLDAQAATAEPKGAHAIGHKATWMMSFGKDGTMPNLKKAIMNCTGVPEEEVTEAFCDQLRSAAQPLAGMFVEFDNRVVSLEDGGLFTVVQLRRRWMKREILAVTTEAALKDLGLLDALNRADE